MIREFLSHLHWTWLPVISMILFMAVFIGACLWVYRKGSQEIYRELGDLPLQEKGEHS